MLALSSHGCARLRAAAPGACAQPAADCPSVRRMAATRPAAVLRSGAAAATPTGPPLQGDPTAAQRGAAGAASAACGARGRAMHAAHRGVATAVAAVEEALSSAAGPPFGPEVSERLEHDCRTAIRGWCKLGAGAEVNCNVEHYATSGMPGHVTAATAAFSGPDGRRHVVLAVAIAVVVDEHGNVSGSSSGKGGSSSGKGGSSGGKGGSSSGSSSSSGEDGRLASGGWRGPPATTVSERFRFSPGSGAPSLDALPGLALHWGTAQKTDGRWHGPGQGWHTQPGVSYDAGGGAWQTPLAVRQAIPLEGNAMAAAYSVLIQVPYEGAAKTGGIVFVLKTARNQWFKAQKPPSRRETNFWAPITDAPVVSTAAQAPDVFFMTKHDSLPTVAKTMPKEEEQKKQQQQPKGEEQKKQQQQPKGGNGSSVHASGDGNGNGAGAHQSGSGSRDTDTEEDEHFAIASAAAAAGGGGADAALLSYAASFVAVPHPAEALLRSADRHPLPQHLPACGWMVDSIANKEADAQRSLMHRYGIGAELVGTAAASQEPEGALAAITAWFRFSAQRHLVWNRNYNVKPREVSGAQARLAEALAHMAHSRPSPTTWLLARVALTAVGRGGSGEVGQRIRDEILWIQQRNGCKGGMMEEWHQKLHNNTSPDDVIICKALLDYLDAGLDITAYWRTLSAAGITAQRLASFDRPIVSEPRFSAEQVPGIKKDLTTYLEALQAVHGGGDLRSAVNNVLGYKDKDLKGKVIEVPPASAIASPELAKHLRALLAVQQHLVAGGAAYRAPAQPPRHATRPQPPPGTEASAGGRPWNYSRRRSTGSGSAAALAATSASSSAAGRMPGVAAEDQLAGLPGISRLLAMAVEARHRIKPFLDKGNDACGGRLVDVTFLDMALDGLVRTTIESSLTPLREAVVQALTPASVPAAAGAAARNGNMIDSEALNWGASLSSSSVIPTSGPNSFAGSAIMGSVLEILRLVVENAALSVVPNDDLVYSNKWLRLLVAQEDPRDSKDRMLQALAICDRVKRALADGAAATNDVLQPAVEALGGRLGISREAAGQAAEEVVRGGSAAPLAQLLALLEPRLRRATGAGQWQIVSRGSERPVTGKLRIEHDLAAVQHEVLSEATVLLVNKITGAEEIPFGAVAVLVSGETGNCPDVLSHSAVRARNMGVLLAACFDAPTLAQLHTNSGNRVLVRLQGSDVVVDVSRGQQQ